MKCVICHGDDIQVTEVKEELRVENDVVCVSIKVPVCRACGERYYDRRTVRFLEEVDQRVKEGKANLREVGKVMMYG